MPIIAMPLCYLSNWRRQQISFLLILFSIFMNIMDAKKTEHCIESSCFCFEDLGELEYQCPNNKGQNKLVIHKGGSQHIRVECWNIESIDLLLPNITFSGPDVTISDCPVTVSTGIIFKIDEVAKLKIEYSKIDRTFVQHFFTLPMNRLTKLSLKSSTVDSEFDGIVAPNLTSIALEEIDIQIGAKLFRNSLNLLKLSLGFNNITDLDEHIFENLTRLEILQLSQNKISYLGENIFGNLYALRDLQLDFNDLETISDGTFRNLRNLYFLDISNNNIQKISREVLRPLEYIQNIYMDYNAGIQLDDYLFSNFSQLKAVFLGKCEIKYLPDNLFLGSGNITLLSLEHNQIMYIPTALFRDLINLRILNLNNNRLMKLNDGIFRTLGRMKILNLYCNEITGLDSDIFKSLTVLEELNLNDNEISYINNDSFIYNLNLRIINLSNNRYTYEIERGQYFSVNPFSFCPNLIDLDLSNNFVKDILEDLLIHAKHLKNLNLRGNKIESVDVSSLWKLAKKGIILNLEWNHITNFIFDSISLPEEETYSSDESLYDDDSDSLVLISNNPLNCDCYAEKFLDLITYKMTPTTDLGIIFKYDELTCDSPSYLNNTKFSEISSIDLVCPLDIMINFPTCTSSKACRCFWRPHDKTIVVDCIRRNLTSPPQILISVNLDYNQTEVHLEGNDLEMGPNEELGYNNVTKLYLSDNHLSDLVWIPPRIEVLDLVNNNLKHISYDVLKILNESSFENLTLENNTWACECETFNLTNFLRRNIKKVDAHRLRCHNIEALLIDLTEAEICEDNTVTYMTAIIVLCTILSILLMMLTIYYKYRQEIKVWLYARNICSRFFEEEELDKHKKYDVFISYSHKDEDFVVEHLVSELEKGPYPYKLCLHYRDWIPGSFIVDNIASSVLNSKRTLVVLTPNFLESVWGKMEFKTAHTEAMKERRHRVILILKDNLPIDSLDDELGTYIKTNTYIKWKDIWFWDKLKYALPHKRV